MDGIEEAGIITCGCEIPDIDEFGGCDSCGYIPSDYISKIEAATEKLATARFHAWIVDVVKAYIKRDGFFLFVGQKPEKEME